MTRLFVLALMLSGCGFLAETVSDSISLDLDTDVIPEASFAENDLEPLTVSFSLDASNPSYSLAGLDTTAWMPVLDAEWERRREGGTCTLTACGAEFDMNMTSFTLTGDYVVNFDVHIFSRPRADDLPGLVFPLSGDEQPVDPASCSFTLEPTVDDGDDYAAHLKVCLSDWLDTNGLPMEFDMEVTSSQGAARQPQEYSTTGFWEMNANRRISSGTSKEILDLDQDVLNNLDLIECSNITFRGSGYTDTPLDSIRGNVLIYNGALRDWVALAMMKETNLPAGLYFAHKEGDDGDLKVTDTRIVITFPAGSTYGYDLIPGGDDNFMKATLEAAAASTESFGIAGWRVIADYPRNGSIAAKIVGPCKFK